MKPWEETWHVDIHVHDTLGPQCEGIHDEHGHRVVETDSGVYPPSIPQAHLIAAAPELYRALEALFPHVEPMASTHEALGAAYAALRNARGGT